MKAFAYSRAQDAAGAVAELSSKPETKLLGGGTNLVDLMKMGVEKPEALVDINRVPLNQIELADEKKILRIGALVRNSECAAHPLVRENFPVLSEAILSGASPQLRNRATTGGNLLQRTRCPYFYDPEFPSCNKRNPGSGCGALEGFNRMHAVLGQGPEHCIAVHPSDMCVALAAIGAAVRVRGPGGERSIPFDKFHRLPEDHPEKETELAPDELILAVDLPMEMAGRKSVYLKTRDRESYAFALVSVAATLKLSGKGTIESAGVALGGVAHKPWRAREAEKILTGGKPSPALFQKAAEAELKPAKGYRYNAFKIELAKRAMIKALEEAAAKT